MWCNNDKLTFQSSPNGQINPNLPVGKLIIDIVRKNQFRSIVDIGTWNGMGSTRCFLIGLEGNSTTQFISLETNKDKNAIAKHNLASWLKVAPNKQLLWGGILRPEDMTDIASVFPSYNQNPEFQRWHSIDVENIKLAPNVFDQIPEEIDFILFDGGEFTTYYEFQKLFPRCVKYIALDDVNVEKCSGIRSALAANPEWKEVAYIRERNGFSLFEKINS